MKSILIVILLLAGCQTNSPSDHIRHSSASSPTTSDIQTQSALDINKYLGLLINTIDLQGNSIEIDMFNLSDYIMETTYPRSLFEGTISIKTKASVKVFYHKSYLTLLQTSIWMNPTSKLKANEVVQYKSKLSDFIDLHETTNLKSYLESNSLDEIMIRVDSDSFMLYPPVIPPYTHSSTTLTSGWHNHRN